MPNGNISQSQFKWQRPATAIYRVGAELKFTTVQAAINEAVADGHTSNTNPAFIEIYPGTYTEDLTLAPGIHLIGMGTRVANAPLGDATAGNPIIIGNHTYTQNNAALNRTQARIDVRAVNFSCLNGVCLTIAGNQPAEIQMYDSIVQKQTGGDVNPAFRMSNTNANARMRFFDSSIDHNVATSDAMDLQGGVTEMRGRVNGVFSNLNVTLNSVAVMSGSATLNCANSQAIANGPFVQIVRMNSATARANFQMCRISNTLVGGHAFSFAAAAIVSCQLTIVVLQDATAKLANSIGGSAGTLLYDIVKATRQATNNNNSSDPTISVLDGLDTPRVYNDGSVIKLQVGGFNGYTTIQEAFNFIASTTLGTNRWEIVIKPGIYNENLNIAIPSNKLIIVTNDTGESGSGAQFVPRIAPVTIQGKVTITSNGGTLKFSGIRLVQTGADYLVDLNPTAGHFLSFEKCQLVKTGADTLEMIKNDVAAGFSTVVFDGSRVSNLNAQRLVIRVGTTNNFVTGITNGDLFYRGDGNLLIPVDQGALNDESITAFNTIQTAIDQASELVSSNSISIVIAQGTYTEDPVINTPVSGEWIFSSKNDTSGGYVGSVTPVQIVGKFTIAHGGGTMKFRNLYFLQQGAGNVLDIQATGFCFYNFENCMITKNSPDIDALVQMDATISQFVNLFNTILGSNGNNDRRYWVIGSTGNPVTGITPSDMYYSSGNLKYYQVNGNSQFSLLTQGYPKISVAVEEAYEHGGNIKCINIAQGNYVEDVLLDSLNADEFMIQGEPNQAVDTRDLSMVQIQGKITFAVAFGRVTFKNLWIYQTGNDIAVDLKPRTNAGAYFENCRVEKVGNDATPVIQNIAGNGFPCQLNMESCTVASVNAPLAGRIAIDQSGANTSGIVMNNCSLGVAGAGLEQNHVLLNMGGFIGEFTNCRIGGFTEKLINLAGDLGVYFFKRCNFATALERGQVFYFEGDNNYVDVVNTNMNISNLQAGGVIARKGTQATALIAQTSNVYPGGSGYNVNGANFVNGVDFAVGGTAAITAQNIATAINLSINPLIQNKIYAIANGDNVELYSWGWEAAANLYTLALIGAAPAVLTAWAGGADGAVGGTFQYGAMPMTFPYIQGNLNVQKYTETTVSVG